MTKLVHPELQGILGTRLGTPYQSIPLLPFPPIHSTEPCRGWMDYVTASSMEWMEMDARTIHFHAVDTWTVDVEWIASLAENTAKIIFIAVPIGKLKSRHEVRRLGVHGQKIEAINLMVAVY